MKAYRFTKSGSGALVLPEHSYSFDYELEEDTLKVDFEKSNLRDSTFKVSIVDGVISLWVSESLKAIMNF
ncbi:DUF5640 domain-containing protein [Oribacterium sp. KHPX15]|uniref:DUF5640 domain-containing protein n=1 Tax=Oribacterium sp. KHPX15 TaxID=1855342 RepID=UPI003FA5376D